MLASLVGVLLVGCSSKEYQEMNDEFTSSVYNSVAGHGLVAATGDTQEVKRDAFSIDELKEMENEKNLLMNEFADVLSAQLKETPFTIENITQGDVMLVNARAKETSNYSITQVLSAPRDHSHFTIIDKELDRHFSEVFEINSQADYFKERSVPTSAEDFTYETVGLVYEDDHYLVIIHPMETLYPYGDKSADKFYEYVEYLQDDEIQAVFKKHLQ